MSKIILVHTSESVLCCLQIHGLYERLCKKTVTKKKKSTRRNVRELISDYFVPHFLFFTNLYQINGMSKPATKMTLNNIK